jgi:hypothetical protein
VSCPTSRHPHEPGREAVCFEPCRSRATGDRHPHAALSHHRRAPASEHPGTRTPRRRDGTLSCTSDQVTTLLLIGTSGSAAAGREPPRSAWIRPGSRRVHDASRDPSGRAVVGRGCLLRLDSSSHRAAANLHAFDAGAGPIDLECRCSPTGLASRRSRQEVVDRPAFPVQSTIADAGSVNGAGGMAFHRRQRISRVTDAYVVRRSPTPEPPNWGSDCP